MKQEKKKNKKKMEDIRKTYRKISLAMTTFEATFMIWYIFKS
jgi:hypothetical protein